MTKLLLIAGLLFFCPPAHDFHVSTTTIRYVPEREQIQIEMHVFLDDLELALTEAGAPKLYIGTKDEMPQVAEHLSLYLEKRFALHWNGEYCPTGLLGYELSEDMEALWIYLQGKSREPLRSISVENSVITEIYDDQKNVVKVEDATGSPRTTLLLSRDQPRAGDDY